MLDRREYVLLELGRLCCRTVTSASCETIAHLMYCRLWRLTLAAYLSANNVQAVYHCLQVSTRGSSILSDRNVCSGCCQHWPSLSSFSSTWSDGAQNENDNIWITQFCTLRTMCLERSACIIHHTWTVSGQTKDNTILLGLRDVTLALSWLFRPLE